MLDQCRSSPCSPLCSTVLRVLTELVSKMRDMQMDKTELGCLRAIVLFNPGKMKVFHPGKMKVFHPGKMKVFNPGKMKVFNPGKMMVFNRYEAL